MFLDIKVTDCIHYCKINFLGNSKSTCKYALYIYDNGDVTKLDYRNDPEFTYFYQNESSVISFKLFIRDLGSAEIVTQSFNDAYLYRNCTSIDNINFRESFETDYISNWRTPIKFIKNNNFNKKKLYVFLNGALSNHRRYPVYNRISWHEKFNAHCLYIYDSSLSQSHDYLLAWYFGNHKKVLYKDLKKLVDKAKCSLNLSNEQIIFYGSSGGGFAALKLSELFIGSIAVAINPQIEVFKYSNQQAVSKFVHYSFGPLPRDRIEAEYKDWIKINPNAFKKGGSKFIYVQNIIDGEHYRNHLKPFWYNFSSNLSSGYDDENHNQLIIYDHPSGHAGEPPEVLDNILFELNKI